MAALGCCGCNLSADAPRVPALKAAAGPAAVAAGDPPAVRAGRWLVGAGAAVRADEPPADEAVLLLQMLRHL